MRRLEATLGAFGPADMFAVNRHLWVRWGMEGGEMRLHCRYYTERPGKVEETGTLIDPWEEATAEAFVQDENGNWIVDGGDKHSDIDTAQAAELTRGFHERTNV